MFSTIAAASIGHTLAPKSDPQKRQENRTSKNDGCTVRSIADAKLYPIITDNRYNQKKKIHTCLNCKTYSSLDGSYISLVDESDFITDPDKYIENAFAKSEKANEFELSKQR